MEGFIKSLKKKYINCPDLITKDNVNTLLFTSKLDDEDEGWTFLEESLRTENDDITHWLLTLSPSISYFELYPTRNYKLLKTLLDLGADPNSFCRMDGEHIINCDKGLRSEWFFETLVDYGANPFDMSLAHQKEHFDYTKISQRRVFCCRKALLTILYTCTVSPFRPVVEIFLCAARQIWDMKGGEGVGPRGHGWFVKL